LNLDKNKPVIKEIMLDGHFRIFTGGGCNSAVLISADRKKAVVVDTKYFSGAKEQRARIPAADITVINTHFHVDHAGGNRLYPDAHVISGKAGWLWYLDTGFAKLPDEPLLPGGEIVMDFDNEKIHILCMGRAHSDNDSVVFFEKRKLLMAGDLAWEKVHPVVAGSNLTAWRAALKTLETGFAADTVVPGHGNITDMKAVFSMEEYFDSIAGAVGDREKTAALKEKYGNYELTPLISGVSITALLIKCENRRKAGK
jgi:cyclase